MSSGGVHRKKEAPKAVTDWIAQIVDEVFEEKRVRSTDPKNLNVKSLCPAFPEEIPVFIEISQGSHTKYEWDVQHNIMVLDRVLSSAVFYPYDYGFIPQTLCEDGDPLDVLVIGSNSVLPGVVVKARVLGYLDFEDVNVDAHGGESYVRDEKLIAVLKGDQVFEGWRDMTSVPERVLNMIKEFFANYKNLDKKTKLKPSVRKGWKSREEALQLIVDTHQRFSTTLNQELSQRKQY